MKNTGHRLVCCGLALLLWLLVYASGTLIETLERRIVLQPNAMKVQYKDDKTMTALIDQVLGEKLNKIWSFCIATLCFTPTNLALLTLIAAFIGGCVSNVVVDKMHEKERNELPPRRFSVMAEHPLAAATRGFVVYLCVIAGVFLAIDDPFKNTTPGQYARLAGTLSLIAFVVGYDQTRIEGWLKLAPGPGAGKPENQNLVELQHQDINVHQTNSPPNSQDPSGGQDQKISIDKITIKKPLAPQKDATDATAQSHDDSRKLGEQGAPPTV